MSTTPEQKLRNDMLIASDIYQRKREAGCDDASQKRIAMTMALGSLMAYASPHMGEVSMKPCVDLLLALGELEQGYDNNLFKAVQRASRTSSYPFTYWHTRAMAAAEIDILRKQGHAPQDAAKAAVKKFPGMTDRKGRALDGKGLLAFYYKCNQRKTNKGAVEMYWAFKKNISSPAT